MRRRTVAAVSTIGTVRHVRAILVAVVVFAHRCGSVMECVGWLVGVDVTNPRRSLSGS